MIFLYLNIMEKAKDKTRENIKDFRLYVPWEKVGKVWGKCIPHNLFF